MVFTNSCIPEFFVLTASIKWKVKWNISYWKQNESLSFIMDKWMTCWLCLFQMMHEYKKGMWGIQQHVCSWTRSYIINISNCHKPGHKARTEICWPRISFGKVGRVIVAAQHGHSWCFERETKVIQRFQRAYKNKTWTPAGTFYFRLGAMMYSVYQDCASGNPRPIRL